jgi:hypothetical protein
MLQLQQLGLGPVDGKERFLPATKATEEELDRLHDRAQEVKVLSHCRRGLDGMPDAVGGRATVPELGVATANR